MRRSFSSMNPVFCFVAIKARRFLRYLDWWTGGKDFAKTIAGDPLPYRVYKHQSVLIRKLGGSDIGLQYGKVENLKIALKQLNGILIRPGERFSFCYLVGRTTRRKGYVDGMLLSNGEAVAGVGGGLCQIANLIHWLCLHSPLTVTERHHHSYDPFPDEGRVVPFGSGATVFYNYIDYQLKNNTEYTFQMLFWLDEKCLNGDLRTDKDIPYKYHVFEKNHQFVKTGASFYRRNELWREKHYKKGSGETVEAELIQKNNALVKYVPAEYSIV